jgi:hypothetical protein
MPKPFSIPILVNIFEHFSLHATKKDLLALALTSKVFNAMASVMIWAHVPLMALARLMPSNHLIEKEVFDYKTRTSQTVLVSALIPIMNPLTLLNIR